MATTTIEILTLLEKQTGKRVKSIRTDNGTEYVNATLTEFLQA